MPSEFFLFGVPIAGRKIGAWRWRPAASGP
jgi:hypothetical protein